MVIISKNCFFNVILNNWNIYKPLSRLVYLFLVDVNKIVLEKKLQKLLTDVNVMYLVLTVFFSINKLIKKDGVVRKIYDALILEMRFLS